MAKALKFGVEIEFFGVQRSVVEQALNRAGVHAVTEEYNHNTKGYWKLVTDASVNRDGCQNANGRGNEIVSPVLHGEDGLRELELVCKVLGECGAKVDKTCGIHVHHDVNGYTAQQLKNIYVVYYRGTKGIDAMMPKSRRSENTPYFAKGLNDTYINRVMRCDSISEMKSELGHDRYYSVNFCSYVKYGTVEFRQHAGSVEFNKIGNWVRLTHRICEASKSNYTLTVTDAMKAETKSQSKWYLVKLAGKNDELKEYMLDRMEYFKAREERVEA